MESSGHSLVEAELLEEKSRALILEAKSTTEDTEKQEKEKQLESKSLTREPEISDEGEVMDFQQLYLNEKKLQLEAQYQLKECKLKISSLEKHLDKEQIANKKLVEKCDALQTELSQQALLRTDAELKIEDEHNKIRKVQKCFEREWEEFERRLIEERAAKSEAEQQLSVLMRQLEEERNSKTVLQRDLDALQEKFSRRQEEFEKQRRIGEMDRTENAMHENKTQPDLESSDWIISRSEVEIIEERGLGTGGWGVVKEGKFRGCKVAVKQIHELILSPHNKRLFMREMNIASRCRHPCLLQFIGATNDDGIPLFVTELMDTSLRDLLDKKPLPKADVVNIALDVARALNYLHLNRPSIIHRDISSANVLLWRRDNQWRAKVSDYGTANFMRQCKTINPGSVIYSAPEALSTEQSPKVCCCFLNCSLSRAVKNFLGSRLVMNRRRLWNSHQRHKFLRAETSRDILKFRISEMAFSVIFKRSFPPRTKCFFNQNTRKTGNDAVEMSQAFHDIARFTRFTGLNLNKYAFNFIQCCLFFVSS